jgi:hypothetical protein
VSQAQDPSSICACPCEWSFSNWDIAGLGSGPASAVRCLEGSHDNDAAADPVPPAGASRTRLPAGTHVNASKSHSDASASARATGWLLKLSRNLRESAVFSATCGEVVEHTFTSSGSRRWASRPTEGRAGPVDGREGSSVRGRTKRAPLVCLPPPRGGRIASREGVGCDVRQHGIAGPRYFSRLSEQQPGWVQQSTNRAISSHPITIPFQLRR